jgi:hypothetical protein
MSVRDQLLDDLCRAPDDWKLRGVLADWFEDNNHAPEAECLYWMIKNKKRPYHGSSPQASWFNADKVGPGLGDPESDVPGAVYDLLEGGKVTANHRTFDDLKAAEEAFLAAFVKARKKGWKPADLAAAEKAEKPKAAKKTGTTKKANATASKKSAAKPKAAEKPKAAKNSKKSAGAEKPKAAAKPKAAEKPKETKKKKGK